MKKIHSIVLFIIFFAGCGLINKNINARKNIKHCKFEFEKFQSVKLDFKPEILIDSKIINISSEKNAIADIIKYLPYIRLKKFKVLIDTITLYTEIKIFNPNKDEVVLDIITADIYIDDVYVSTVEHKDFIRIEADKSVNTLLKITIPGEMKNVSLSSAKKITLKAQISARILIGKSSIAFPFPIKTEFDYPREKIIKIIDENMDKVLKSIIEKAEKHLDSMNSIIDKAAGKLNSNGIDTIPEADKLKKNIQRGYNKLLDRLGK